MTSPGSLTPGSSAAVAMLAELAEPHEEGDLVALRSALRPIDVELLEFLSSHAATALQLADLRSAESRRRPSLL